LGEDGVGASPARAISRRVAVVCAVAVASVAGVVSVAAIAIAAAAVISVTVGDDGPTDAGS
jgi:hypothetical protein